MQRSGEGCSTKRPCGKKITHETDDLALRTELLVTIGADVVSLM